MKPPRRRFFYYYHIRYHIVRSEMTRPKLERRVLTRTMPNYIRLWCSGSKTRIVRDSDLKTPSSYSCKHFSIEFFGRERVVVVTYNNIVIVYEIRSFHYSGLTRTQNIVTIYITHHLRESISSKRNASICFLQNIRRPIYLTLPSLNRY